MNEIQLIHQRLIDSDGLPAVLAAGWDVFELAGTIASARAAESADMYPAFTFARGAAVTGRNALALASSMPVSRHTVEGTPDPAGDVYEIADALADLTSALSTRLWQWAELAADAADRSACENAAGEAQRITWFLAKGNS